MAWRLGLTGQPATPGVLTVQNRCCQNQNIPGQWCTLNLAEEYINAKIANFLEKSQKKFGVCKNCCTFVIPSKQQGLLGSLAQLVQSVCLTSRGSGVRLPQLPQNENQALTVHRRCLFRMSSGIRPVSRVAFQGIARHPATAETLQKLYNFRL